MYERLRGSRELTVAFVLLLAIGTAIITASARGSFRLYFPLAAVALPHPPVEAENFEVVGYFPSFPSRIHAIASQRSYAYRRPLLRFAPVTGDSVGSTALERN